MELKIAVPGAVYYTELSTAQVPIAVGAGTFAQANNIATIAFAAAHGLTLTPAAGTAPNFFVQISGATAQTGTGSINGPIFRILAIPSTTTIQIYTTVTAANVTAATVTPVFIPSGASIIGSAFVNGPTMLGVLVPPAYIQSATINFLLGTNCTVQYNPDNTSFILDQTTGNTPATAPVFRTLNAASTGGQIWFDGVGGTAIFASGGAGTSRWSVIE